MQDHDRSFVCPCCQLHQPKQADQYGVSARVCRDCTWHQGSTPDKRMTRAEKHEELVRERLDRCRSSEAEAQQVARTAREAAAAAPSSRGRLALRLDEAVSAEPARRLQALMMIARSDEVVRWARKQRAIDEC